MSLCCLSFNKSLRKMSIYSNDYYSKDLINYLKSFFDLELKRNFHLFDILYNKSNGFDLLNIEFNSLDVFTFSKMLELIYINISLTSLNISFFSADVSYLITNLFRIYTDQIQTSKKINEYISIKGKNFRMEEFEKKILDDISIYFVDYLSVLFELIKNKSDLKEIGFNFDFPDILINNNKYKIPIYKFILNIIMLIDNNESKSVSNIKKLTILSPKIILDKKLDENIDNFFQNMSLYTKSKTLMNLNIEFQLHKMSYIKNIISTNLFSLSIGDMDIYTFDKLVLYLTSYSFSTQSNLTKLSIKLIGTITSFNTQLKLILQRLFNINLKNLLELNLFTNFIIDKKSNYSFLIKLLHNNWIPCYNITLNEKSKNAVNYYNLFRSKKILYLVSESIQNYVFKEGGNLFIRRNNFHGNDIYWILKIIFFRRRKGKETYFGNNEIQYLIFTILKYLFLTSNVQLEHKYNIEKKAGNG